MTQRKDGEDLRAATRLLVDATTGVTGVVEAMHRSIASGPSLLGEPLKVPASVVTSLIYGTIRGVTKLVGHGIDQALEQLAPLLGESVPGSAREGVQSALNGVLGDLLEKTRNPLAISMQLQRNGRPIDLAAPGNVNGRVLMLVHGSSMNDLQWNQEGHDHGEALALELGVTPVYVLYNSGRHISTNGAELARLIERLCTSWPVPVEQVVLVGHSMGGLVARSACHAADQAQLSWRPRLRALVTLGSPHHGAPLERTAPWVEFLLGLSTASAPLRQLAHIRSAGVTDLRFGNVRDEDWQGRDRFLHATDTRTPLPLPKGVRCCAIAGSLAVAETTAPAGDGLVPVDSALGISADVGRTLGFPLTQQRVVFSTGHIALLGSVDVFAALCAWLE